jgi:hypothetical protein
MAADLQKELNESLARVEAVFMPGRLGDRRDEMRRLREAGDTMFFSGGVRWSVFLTDYDKKLRGESESLDAAFGDMSSCLSFLASDHGEETQVVCAVEAGEKP